MSDDHAPSHRAQRRVAARVGTAVVALLSISGIAAQTSSPPFKPAPRVCKLCDLGMRAGDPFWLKEPGLFVKGAEGDLYTTSTSGGKKGQGTIFKISPRGRAPQVLFDFDLNPHGANPYGGLVDGKDGSFYGTTYTGGVYRINDAGDLRLGAGTVFKFTPGSSAPEELHTFRNGALTGIKPEICEEKKPCKYSPQQRLNAAGGYPLSAPVRASDGNFYGVASYSNNQKWGVLYRVQPYKGESGITGLCMSGEVPQDPDITEAQLRASCMFTGTNGNYPMTLVPSPDGNLYGATWGGNAADLYGTVFRAATSGRVTTIHRFDSRSGAKPHSLAVGPDGTLYGSTLAGGVLSNGKAAAGIVYKLTPAGAFEVLHAFGGTDGSEPLAGVTVHTNERGKTVLFGATRYGGLGRGALYRVSADVNPNTLAPDFDVVYRHPWSWGEMGRTPVTTLFELDGVLYGTTYQGGLKDGGVIFRVSGMDPPAVQTITKNAELSPGQLVLSKKMPLSGQEAPVEIEVRTKVQTTARVAPNTEVFFDDGITIGVSNCPEPHILQFIYREKLGVDGVPFGGGYATVGLDGTVHTDDSYQFTTDPKAPVWHTDARSGKPNAYYEKAAGTAREVGPYSLRIFDQPGFAAPIFMTGAHETWRAVFKDYVICGCEVVGEVRWAREMRWKVDLSAGPNVIPDLNRGRQLPAEYVDVAIVPSPDRLFTWANKQLASDGYDPVPYF